MSLFLGRFTAFSLLVVLSVHHILAQDHDYSDALHLTTYFLGAQRCGDNDSWIHDACHTRDGEQDGVDLEGGWHDCGDHIKFGQTNSFTSACLLQMYDRFPIGYDDRYSQAFSAPPANGIPDILDEVKIFTDYLMKALTGGKVFYQVGTKATDYKTFAEASWQSTNLSASNGGDPRKAYFKTSGASNFCGSAAATLALMAMNYEEYDSAYAVQCLAKAIEYYDMGNTSPQAVQDVDENKSYNEGMWMDDMALGGVCLYRATGDSDYLSEAEYYYETGRVMPRAYIDWGNIGPVVAYELYKETEKKEYKDDLADAFWTGEEYMRWCGYAHFMDWGSLKYSTAAAQVAFYYHDISGDAGAYAFGKANVDFVLGSHDNLEGDAPANFSFIIGYDKLGGGSPKYPHHASAFGKTSNSWTYFSEESDKPGSVPFAHELKGALVGGPGSPCGDYVDKISDYRSNEVCTYYNAHIVGDLAYIKKVEGITPITIKPAGAIKGIGNYTISKINGTGITLPSGLSDNSVVNVFNLQGKLISAIKTEGRRKIDLSEINNISKGAYIVKVINR